MNPFEQLFIAYTQWLDQWFCEVERFLADVRRAVQAAAQ